MAPSILKPLTDDELKVRVGEFMNSFIALNKKNKASLEELKESYHDAHLMLYHILKGSNGLVDSTRLLDIIQTLVINYMLENDMTDGRIRSISEQDKRFICFLGILLSKYIEGHQGPKKEEWINKVIDAALRKKWYD
jgi:hypothetical protein